MVDKVRPLKQESSSIGGTENDFLPTSTDPAEDYLSAKGIAFAGTDATLIGESSGAINFTTGSTLRGAIESGGGFQWSGHSSFGSGSTISSGIIGRFQETTTSAIDLTAISTSVAIDNVDASGNGLYGADINASLTGAAGKVSSIFGVVANANITSTPTGTLATQMYGGSFIANHQGTGTASLVVGSKSAVYVDGSFSSPVATSAIGHIIEMINNSGTITTAVGLSIVDMSSVGTTSWAIQSNGGQSYHAGNLRIGSTSAPTVALDVTGAAKFSTPIEVASGGTSFASYTVGDLVYASGTTAFTKLGIGSAGKILRSSGTAPAWSTSTYPDTISTGDILAATGTNVIGVIASASIGRLLSSNGVGSAATWSTATFPGTATTGNLIYASGTNAYANLTVGTANQVLTSNGTIPAWGQVSLTAGVTGTLPLGNGGTGSTAFTAGSIPFSNGTILTQNNSKLFWSDTLGKLGLGTASPSAYLHVSPVATTGTVDPDLKITGASHTALTASAERNVIRIDPGTQTWSTGSLTNQRAIHITQPTVAFAGASSNGVSATVYIAGNPIEGANATIGDAISLWIDDQGTSPVTNTYGIFCKANQSATTNRYSGHFEGGQFILKDASSTVGKILRCMTSGNTEFFTVASTGINCEGTTLYGNDTASGNLTLESTTNATKGYVKVNSSIQMGGTYKFLFQDNSANFLTIQPPGTITTHSLTLPASQGAADSYLKNDGSGGLTWSTGPGAIKAYVLLGAVNGVGGSVTSDAPYGDSGAYAGFVALAAGTVEAIAGNMSLSRTAGTCTARWLKNGVVQSGTAIIDGTNTTTKMTSGLSVAYAANDVITLQSVTSSFTPTGSDMQISLFIKDS